MLTQGANILIYVWNAAVLNNDFDPYDVLERHDATLDQLVKAHNEVANLAEQLAESLVVLNAKLDKIEKFVLRNIDETE